MMRFCSVCCLFCKACM